MLDYPALAAMAAVVREGSFERAAKALGITPSAVSQRVRALEERLGSVLIQRGQPCVPTDLGRMLCAHVDQVRLLEADLAPVLGPALAHKAQQTIPLAINADSLATWFPQAAARFVQATGMLLDLRLDDEQHTAARLRSGEVLGAITAEAESPPGCRGTPLGSLRYVACASPAFVARHFGGKVDAQGLSQARCLGFDRRDLLQARWARQMLGVSLRAPTLWVPSTHAFVDFALAGAGWAMQPMHLAAPHLASGRLVELVPGTALDVPLFWNVVRLHATSLRSLSEAIVAAARAALVEPIAVPGFS